METKLAHITTQYKRFTKNQVLTEGHLNEVLDYFDDQIRLSRIFLDGVGLVCGFNLKCNANSLEISQGSGITTDGDLFQLYELDEENNKILATEAQLFTHFKPYVQDPEKVLYKPFFFQGESQIPLFELHTSSDDDEALPISQMQAETGFALKDGVVLLYLENYLKEKDLCVSLTCDNQGDEIVGNYKVLITTLAGAAHIKSNDPTLNATNFEALGHNLPDVWHNRAIMLREDFNSYPVLKNKFAAETLKNDLIDRLKSAYGQLLSALGMSELGTIFNLKADELFTYTEDNVPPDFQYRYDLLKDLIDTYSQIKTLLLVAEAQQCTANLEAFPKHLMLGELTKTGDCYAYRHGFYKAPVHFNGTSNICGTCDPLETTSTAPFTIPELVLDYEDANLEVCYSKENTQHNINSLIKRALLMITNYNANYNFVKVTPSLNLGPLNNKAIPFYFNVGNQLIAAWDFGKTINGQQHDNLSYHQGFLKIKEPLKFSIDHNFYRVEGHQGKNYLEVINLLTDIKRLNAISFNVVALPINATEAQEVVENYTSYFLERNVGLDHKAGVVPGGTFVIIYIEGEYSDYPYPYGYGYPYGYPGDGSPFGADFEVMPEDEETTVVNPVVADFMLPYLCCDQNMAECSLPTDFICFDETTAPLPFTVKPEGGFVMADVPVGLHGGVTLNDAGTFEFDPNLVSPELHGTPIAFKVNSLETDCEITVQERINFELEVSNITYDRPTNTANATLEIMGTDIPADTEFTWDFGDGSDPVTGTALSVDHNFNLGIVGETGALVRVTNNAGDCSSQDTLALVFEIFTNINLPKESFCNNDPTPHVFTLTPPDSEAIIDGPGVSQVGTNWVFIANGVSAGDVTFTVDGEPSGYSVQVAQAPIAEFSVEVLETELLITNSSSITDRYIFTIDGEERVRLNRRAFSVPLSNFSTDSITVSLIAESDQCGTSSFGPLTVEVNQGGTSCKDVALNTMEAAFTFFANMEADSEFATLQDPAVSLFNDLKERYSEVQSNLDNFLAGSRNDSLPDIFNNSFYTLLARVLTIADTSFQRKVAQGLLEYTVKLIYTILECQDNTVILEFEEQINNVLKSLTAVMESVANDGIPMDDSNTINAYLTGILPRYTSLPFIAERIESQLSLL